MNSNYWHEPVDFKLNHVLQALNMTRNYNNYNESPEVRQTQRINKAAMTTRKTLDFENVVPTILPAVVHLDVGYHYW